MPYNRIAPLHIAHRCSAAAGAFQRVHLAVKHGAALLDAAVVTAADDLPLVHEHRAYRNAALGAAPQRFLDRDVEILIHIAGILPQVGNLESEV